MCGLDDHCAYELDYADTIAHLSSRLQSRVDDVPVDGYIWACKFDLHV